MRRIQTSLFCSIVFLCFTLTQVQAFSDVHSNNPYQEAINILHKENIFSGYKDGTFLPLKNINRAEFTKLLMLASHGEPAKGSYDSACLSDIPKKSWYEPYVCAAKKENIISGYKDSSFKPENPITVAEAFKLTALAFGMKTKEVKDSPWYTPYAKAMDTNGYIPLSLFSYSQQLRRGEAAEILWRAKNAIHSYSTKHADDLKTESCQPLGEELPTSIDMNKVRETWLSWNNGKRTAAKLDPYTLNPQLSRTATTWSRLASAKGSIDHKRYGKKAYYDFWALRDWFKEQGLTFKRVHSQEFVENIGWGVYRCSDADCTDELLSSIRSTFDFFYGEKNKKYRPHYESLMSDTYNEIGVGIAIDEDAGKYYITVHYDTEITSNPLKICEAL